MTGRPSRETVTTALLAALTVAVQTSFTANVANGSPTLSSPSSTADIFVGLPVFGPGVPKGAVISNLSPLTMSLAATADGTAVTLETGFLTIARRVKFTQDTALPALFLCAPKNRAAETLEYQGSMQIQTIHLDMVIGSSAGENPDFVPETALNNFLDALQAAMDPDEENRFTLGGLVHWCRIVGSIDKDGGDLGGVAIAVAGVEIIVP